MFYFLERFAAAIARMGKSGECIPGAGFFAALHAKPSESCCRPCREIRQAWRTTNGFHLPAAAREQNGDGLRGH
ncbi:MAG: hypothetical protein ACKO39_08960, partial [Chthoniobacterales bacterium]